MRNILTQFFSTDHDRLDFLFHNYQLNKGIDSDKAFRFFSKFTSGLEQHIKWEEELLFPAFEEAYRMDKGGPTFVMRAEHKVIKSLLNQIESAISAGRPADQEEQKLVEFLTLHNEKEEQVLYVNADSKISKDQIGEMFLQI